MAMRGKAVVLGLLGASLCGGCAPKPTRFTITSVRAGGAHESLTTTFPTGAFAQDAQRNWDIVFRGRPEPLAIHSHPASTASAAADAPVFTQLLRLRVFWQPQPGWTYAERTQTNANITYCLQRGSSLITYEGGGFVYFSVSSDGRRLEGSLESSSLAPTTRVGDPEDVLGPCRIVGTFTADFDKARTIDTIQQIRRRVGGVAPVGRGPPSRSR